MKKKEKPKRDVLVTHKENVKEVLIKPHNNDVNIRADIKKHTNKYGIFISFKIED